MASIKFDSTEILDTTHVPRFVKHESDPEIGINMAEIARDDGAVIISDKDGVKRIQLQGFLTAATQSALETAIDTFKELFRRTEKNLDISWESGTRRYVATCVRHEFDRDHFHILFVPWTAEFVVAKGVGEGTSETTLISGSTFTTQDYNDTLTFAGSARPKPRIRVENTGTTTTAAKGIEIKNNYTGERIYFTRANLLGNDIGLEVDCRLKTVRYFGDLVDYFGVFPRYVPGSSNGIYVRIGDIIATAFDNDAGLSDSEMPIYGGDIIKPAQSFIVPYTDNTFQGVSLRIRKVGDPGANLSVRIETDSGGFPSGTLAHSEATFTIAKASVDTSFTWILINSTNTWSLSANTKYWIVCRNTGGDGSNYYAWRNLIGSGATYKNGNMANYQSGVGSWIDGPSNDLEFRIHLGGKFDGTKTYKLKVYYYKRYL